MEVVILSSPDTGKFIECSRRHVKTTGQLVKKMIFRFGEFAHPRNANQRIKVDLDFYQKLKQNFEAGVCPIVQFPMVNASNQHVEDPASNLGEVVDITADERGIYAYIDVRKSAEDIGKTILGASAKVHLNYTDTKTGASVGPALLHVAATNRPYLTDLDDYETISASNADTTNEAVLLLSEVDEAPNSEEEKPMTKEEHILALSEMGIDVAAGQKALEDVEGFIALSGVLGDDVVATPEAISSTIVDLTNSIAERDQQISERESRIQELTATIQEINLSEATTRVEAYIKEGRILPANKDDMIELSMTDNEKFERFLLPEHIAQLDLSEAGFSAAQSTHEKDPAEAARLEGERIAKLARS